MIYQANTYRAPATRLGRWLVEPGRDVSAEVRPILLSGLFGSVSIFVGGVASTVLVALAGALRHPEPAFFVWLAIELVVGAVRIGLLVSARRSPSTQARGRTDLYLLLALVWASGVGFGSLLGIASGDWVLATLTTGAAAAMGGGIAFRNFYAPRLGSIMLALSFGVCGIAAALSREPVLWLMAGLSPVYVLTLRKAMYGLNAMLVRTIAAERDNDRRASHDQLTGIANRAGLERAITTWQHREDRRGPLAFFYLDLDGFKAVNDRYGHAAGDALLRMVAARLQALAPAGGTAARIGGDEFVLLVPEEDRGGTLGRAERVIAAVSDRPYDLDNGVSVTVGTSVGIARLPDHGHDVATLMSAADGALYEAKARGRCRAVIATAPALRIAAEAATPRRAAKV